MCGPEGVGIVDIERPIGENIRALARAKNVDVSDIRVAVLDRPRHEQLIADIRAAGAGTRLIMDGDVAAGVNAAQWNSRIDLAVGIGGTPEGIITACAVKALGGVIQGKLLSLIHISHRPHGSSRCDPQSSRRRQSSPEECHRCQPRRNPAAQRSASASSKH